MKISYFISITSFDVFIMLFTGAAMCGGRWTRVFSSYMDVPFSAREFVVRNKRVGGNKRDVVHILLKFIFWETLFKEI